MTYTRFTPLRKTDTFAVHNATTKIAGVKIIAFDHARITAAPGHTLSAIEWQSIAAFVENVC